MASEVASPTVWHTRGELACLLCGRVAAETKGQKNCRQQQVVRLLLPEYEPTVRRLRCPTCGGRLWLRELHDVVANRRPLTPEELHPRAGRPRKTG
ncbi:MAG: hypothetical protein IT305_03195 [Chloroflexi bacterium]|nr:hypothetical protein [Chloroflexota bacterium]